MMAMRRAHDLDDHDAETTCVPAGRGAAHYGRAFARQTLRQHGPALEDYASALEGPRPLGDDSVRKLAWLGRVTCLRALGDDGEARQAACAGLDEGEDMMLRRALDELTRRQGRAISPRERRGGSAVRASIARRSPLHASSS